MADMDFIDAEMLDEFYADVDSLAEQVASGMESIKAGDVRGGIDVIMRPLHTIKGTTAFFGQSGMPEFSKVSTLAHRTEDLLKDIQSDKVAVTQAVAETLGEGTNAVFVSMETIRGGETLDEAALKGLVETLEQARSGGDERIPVEWQDGVHIVRIPFKRVQLPKQYKAVAEAISGIPAESTVAFDLSKVLTMSSTAWGALVEFAERFSVSVFSMTTPVRNIYYMSGFDQMFSSYKDENAFRTTTQDE